MESRMNSVFSTYFDWIDSQREAMIRMVTRWAEIPSGTFHLSGLEILLQELKKDFAVLGGHMQEVSLPAHKTINAQGHCGKQSLGKALSIVKRPEAPLRIFLCVHMDTVYPANSDFQKTMLLNPGTLQGPGVTDAKGGIAILLKSLECLERSPFAKNIGWEVLINPDEEIGSPGSVSLLKNAAERNHLALLFEPCHPNGSLVSSRKGSENFTVVMRGIAAHAGRDFHRGRNAIMALAEWLLELQMLSQIHPELTLNVGNIQGGNAVNVIPDLAIARFNIRTPDVETQKIMDSKLQQLSKNFSKDGITFELHREGAPSPPKSFDEKTKDLAKEFSECAKDLGFPLSFFPSGGVCDGNKLQAFGIPNLDSLGAQGEYIHSDKEFLLLDSLTQRAKLTTMFLLKKASGQL
jgi:glutamate carboxypeptidase